MAEVPPVSTIGSGTRKFVAGPDWSVRPAAVKVAFALPLGNISRPFPSVSTFVVVSEAGFPTATLTKFGHVIETGLVVVSELEFRIGSVALGQLIDSEPEPVWLIETGLPEFHAIDPPVHEMFPGTSIVGGVAGDPGPLRLPPNTSRLPIADVLEDARTNVLLNPLSSSSVPPGAWIEAAVAGPEQSTVTDDPQHATSKAVGT
jgi:hypothetical protein